MLQKIQKKQKIIVLLLMIFVVFNIAFQKASSINAESNPYADNEGFKSKKGDITYNTKMLTATSSITYGTVGWIIRFEPTKGVPIGNDSTPKKGSNDYAVIYYTSEGVECDSKRYPDGYTYSKYKFTEKALDKAVKQAGKKFQEKWENLKSEGGGTIYLNGIFTTYHSGICTNKRFYRHNDIKKAEPWRDPSLFWQYYDIKVEYEAATYPVNVKYLTTNNDVIFNQDLGKFSPKNVIKSGKDYSVPPEYISYDGHNYKLYRSYFKYKNSSKQYSNKKLSSGNSLSEIQHPCDSKGNGIQIKNGGLRIYFRYKLDDSDPDDYDYGDVKKDELEKSFPDLEPIGKIAADNYGDELYDVSVAIPSSDSVYVNVTNIPGYVTSYKFTKVVGKKKVETTVSRDYTIYYDTYIEKKGKKVKSGTNSVKERKSVDVTLEIPYGYWIINHVYVYKVDSATVENGCLPNGKVVLSLNNPIVVPNLESTVYGKKDKHVFLPDCYQKKYEMSPCVQYGTEENHEIVFDDDKQFEAYAASQIPYVDVKNDRLTVDGKVFMSDKLTHTEGPKPSKLSLLDDGKMLEDKELFKDNLVIPINTKNDCFTSTGNVTYVKSQTVKKSYKDSFKEDAEVNDVYVHTPVVCDALITDKKEYNQMITPDKTKNSLILGMYFKIKLPTTGKHNAYKGYGTRDYKKYTAKRQVQFPFGVYRDSTYYEPYDWIDISETETQFYLPTWVHEGLYDIKARSISINAEANNKVSDEFSEDLLNSQSENYVATDFIQVQVTGRLYGLNIYDITDYPLWQDVFRSPKDSLKLSGFTYRNGAYNQNGNQTLENNRFTFPLVNGNHPKYKNVGVVKKGYYTRFRVRTIGDMYNDKDCIYMKPTFYFVPYDGSKFTRVDLYYNETFTTGRKYLVKVGDANDQKNIKKGYIGNPYWNVNDSVLNKTASILNMNLKTFKGTDTDIFTFGNIVLTKGVRTFIGDTSYIPSDTVPTSVGDRALTQSVQEWYGEYYLPSQTFAAPYGFDLVKYISEHGSLDMKEDFWLKDGYIVVNLDISTKENDKWNLSYINRDNHLNDGYCNMWKKETNGNLLKIDSDGNQFHFRYGDFIMYYANKSANDDYTSGGTH